MYPPLFATSPSVVAVGQPGQGLHKCIAVAGQYPQYLGTAETAALGAVPAEAVIVAATLSAASLIVPVSVIAAFATWQVSGRERDRPVLALFAAPTSAQPALN